MSRAATSRASRSPSCAAWSATRRRTRSCSRRRSPKTSRSASATTDDATAPTPIAERVRRAAEAAGLAPDIAALPDGYDTLVGERGITLSGGQRQRVALARALAADPQILILDDSLSSVDAETERNILTRLRPILAGRTSILVSHRVAAVHDADQILVLDAGRVAEHGTHESLMGSGGVYASLYREQLAAGSRGGGRFLTWLL